MGYEGKPYYDDIKQTSNRRYFAKYGHFTIGGVDNKYKLNVRSYSGNAGDSLSYNSGMGFSTFGKDNDKYPSVNCAVNFKGGWWYNACSSSNLNGPWGHSNTDKSAWWYSLSGLNSVSFSEMKLRPRT